MRLGISPFSKPFWSVLWILVLAGSAAADTAGGPPDSTWQVASQRSRDGFDWVVYVETEKTPGRPAFRIETGFDAEPPVAAAAIMQAMSEPGGATAGETRRMLERSEGHALVHTYIDLPFMFSDRELAVRIHHTEDAATGVHRIDWVDDNEVLPPPAKGVLRLSTRGYWEFRPASPGRTSATYVSRAEVGGSLPAALSDRLMKKQAVDAVRRLQGLLASRERTDVAAPPPSLQ